MLTMGFKWFWFFERNRMLPAVWVEINSEIKATAVASNPKNKSLNLFEASAELQCSQFLFNSTVDLK